MKPEYKKVADSLVHELGQHSEVFVIYAISHCEALANEKIADLDKRIAELSDEIAAHERKANKPVRELTDAEIEQIRKFSSAPKPHCDVFLLEQSSPHT